MKLWSLTVEHTRLDDIPGMSESLVPARTSMQERLTRLEIATAALISDASLDAVLQRVVQVSAEVIGARYAAIGVIASSGRVLSSFTTFDIDQRIQGCVGDPPSGLGILGLVIRNAAPIRLADLSKHPDSYG